MIIFIYKYMSPVSFHFMNRLGHTEIVHCALDYVCYLHIFINRFACWICKRMLYRIDFSSFCDVFCATNTPNRCEPFRDGYIFCYIVYINWLCNWTVYHCLLYIVECCWSFWNRCGYFCILNYYYLIIICVLHMCNKVIWVISKKGAI